MVCVRHEPRPENLMAMKNHDSLKIFYFHKHVVITYPPSIAWKHSKKAQYLTKQQGNKKTEA